MGKYLQGRFKPINPHKYNGDVTNIVYRSSYELKYMMFLDKHPDVIEYSSEEFFIPYKSPIDGKHHRYFVDFKVTFKDKSGNKKTVIVEIKPYSQTVEPKKQKKVTKRYINEVTTWGVNSAKWDAARDFCKKNGYEFMIITEKELGIK